MGKFQSCACSILNCLPIHIDYRNIWIFSPLLRRIWAKMHLGNTVHTVQQDLNIWGGRQKEIGEERSLPNTRQAVRTAFSNIAWYNILEKWHCSKRDELNPFVCNMTFSWRMHQDTILLANWKKIGKTRTERNCIAISKKTFLLSEKFVWNNLFIKCQIYI